MTATLLSAESIETRISELVRDYGDWSYDIPLPHGVWTRGNLGQPHKRLRRVLQIANDTCRKPLESCRVLDLAWLDGIFSVEFALHGASVVGIEIREPNIKKAEFCKEALGLENLEPEGSLAYAGRSFVQKAVQGITSRLQVRSTNSNGS